ncbi:PID-CTERM protein-sorting domain-containing protein [Aureispira anguillae]|uniref:Uncharacterized protein n=1 Tax=Aureispira anguillae TaxID=2864201 RepID=A0A915VK93_9BACT|nr:hypothetical protein [Aureispira anguillae]BDS09470.1 hypothetical protein AsAng_0001680 [Aureispira anguillae]
MKTIRTIIKSNWINNVCKLVLVGGFILSSYTPVLAGPPGPPGVPLDGGASFLIAAAVGYGMKTMAGKEKEQ